MSTEPADGPDWLDALRDLAPVDPTDPWGDQADRAGGHSVRLSEDQRAFLRALADMPDVPRLQDVDDMAVTNELPDEIVGPDDLDDLLG
jgi:hypothetical protein